MKDTPAGPVTKSTEPAAPADDAPAAELLPPGNTRTRAEVGNLIQQVGPTLPDWWDSVPLEYPDTLNLQWEQAKEGWAPDHNMGAWMRTRVWERPANWRAGVKVMHHAVEVNKDNPKALKQSQQALAQNYYFLLQDYARAAYWNLQAGNPDPVLLATCCWRLGSKELAVEILSGLRTSRSTAGGAMKLWGEMGEYKRAMALADQVGRYGGPDQAYLCGGDAARVNGRFQDAAKYYRVCAQLGKGGRYLRMHKERARASAAR